MSAEANDTSCVLWLDYGGVSALFTGDVSSTVEEGLLLRDGLDVFAGLGVQLTETEILKVSHHGSSDATSLEFLRYLNVQTAMISCGENNPYRHPTEHTLTNLETVGASVFRTDKQGHIKVTVQNGSYKVSTYK